MAIFTAEELADFNYTLIGRGCPIEEDFMGYNKPDWSICKFYYDVLSYSQLADLSERLIKYCNTQLNLKQEDMVETAHHYNKLAGDYDKENGISIQIGKEWTLVSFRYNPSFVYTLKNTASQRKFDSENKHWFVHNSEVIKTLKALQEKGADVLNSLAYAESKLQHVESEPAESQPEEKALKIKVSQKSEEYVVLGFPYNYNLVEAIKSLEWRKYNPTSKTWTVSIKDIVALTNKIGKMELAVDLSELKAICGTVTDSRPEPIEEIIEAVIPDGMKKTPYEHQLEACKFLLQKKKAILGDDMGLGKTFSSILAGANIQGKKLVLCPASLKYNWEKEIHAIPEQEVIVINGRGYQDTGDNGWTIINYDKLSDYIDDIEESEFKCIIVDEAHYCKAIKNSGKPASKRAELFLEIADQTEYVFILTGTPITNKVKDIFNLLKAVNHPLSRKFFSFAQRYCDAQHNGYGWNFDGASNTAELHERIQSHMLRRTKDMLKGLPEKVRYFIPNKINMKRYEQKVDEYMSERASLTDKGQHLVYLNALRHLLAIEKIQYTKELVDNLLEQDEQVIVFTNYEYVIESLMSQYGEIAVKLTGEVTGEKRQQAVEDFQSGRKKLFVSNIKAGGVGITLTKACNIIVNDFAWNPSDHTQAEDRIYRIGQSRDCNIQYVFAKGTVDEKMADLLETKLNNASMVIDGKEENFLTDDIMSEMINYFN